MSIHILPDDVINKIAAGEVVERPASIVKELVENSLDAGATKIEVKYEQGGMTLLQIRDNGSGIAKADLPMVFQRHATSKIDSIHDLEKISTMGFRGEALASIAAVSNVTLRTRTKDSDIGFETQLTFGKQDKVTKVGMPVGTEITISALFEELPARKKYIRSDQTEGAHIESVMTAFALANPQVGFDVKRGEKTVLSVPEVSSIQDRVAAMWDEDTTHRLEEVFFEHPHAVIRGFVGAPELSGASAPQWLFVNRRHVEDRAVFAAVREGYAGLLPPKGRPFFILFIETPAHLVDVNVHPRKKEVRFATGQFIFQSVKEAVKKTLMEADMTPVINTSIPVTGNDQMSNLGNFANKQSRSYDAVREKSYVPDQRGMLLHDAAFTTKASVPLPWEEPSNQQLRFHVLDNVFVFVFGSDSVTVYDQHALHERVLYEQFLTAFKRGIESSEVQRLLLPQMIKLTAEQYVMLETNLEYFKNIGFDLSLQGSREVKVVAVPLFAKDVPITSYLPDVLEEWGSISDVTAKQDIKLATMACRAAVKAGDMLSEIEIRKLLEQVAILDEKYTCPHGRPFKVVIPRNEIDKWFKRTGF